MSRDRRHNPRQDDKIPQKRPKPISDLRSKNGLIETKKHEKHGLKTFAIQTYVDYERPKVYFFASFGPNNIASLSECLQMCSPTPLKIHVQFRQRKQPVVILQKRFA
jgi:hypothetical protein